MIELTILEAAENIEKYHKETKAWKDKKVVTKDIKTGDLVLKRKRTGRTLGNFMNLGKGHVRGFSFARANWRRITVFVEC
jgi:hypothetical protein